MCHGIWFINGHLSFIKWGLKIKNFMYALGPIDIDGLEFVPNHL